VADYPFTTLHPNLGVTGFLDNEFVIADIPGLIEGAHQGLGLGDRFLGHVERCSILLHLIDVNQKDPLQSYNTIRNELEAYGAGLKNKAEIIGVTKIDTLDYKNAEKIRDWLSKATKKPVFLISSSTQRGLKEVLSNLSLEIKNQKSALKTKNTNHISSEAWSPH
jgi:GTP-binding protein